MGTVGSEPSPQSTVTRYSALGAGMSRAACRRTLVLKGVVVRKAIFASGAPSVTSRSRDRFRGSAVPCWTVAVTVHEPASVKGYVTLTSNTFVATLYVNFPSLVQWSPLP